MYLFIYLFIYILSNVDKLQVDKKMIMNFTELCIMYANLCQPNKLNKILQTNADKN